MGKPPGTGQRQDKPTPDQDPSAPRLSGQDPVGADPAASVDRGLLRRQRLRRLLAPIGTLRLAVPFPSC